MAKKELILQVEEKEFVNKQNGEVVKYFSLVTVIDGQYIKLITPPESKQLFNYLYHKCFGE